MKVWYVWAESGEYEQFSRDLRGTFASKKLAEAHAAQLREPATRYDVVEVVQDVVLDEVPVSVPYVCYTAHIRPDGTEDKALGYRRGSEFSTWSNELLPLDYSRVDPWSHKDRADQYIEVIGSDEILVAAEYERLLASISRDAADRLTPVVHCNCPEAGTSGSCPFHDGRTVNRDAADRMGRALNG